MPLIMEYKEALNLGSDNDRWSARASIDGALKAMKQDDGETAYLYTVRLEMLRVVQEQATAEKTTAAI